MKTAEQLLFELESSEIKDYLSENSKEFVIDNIADILNKIIEMTNPIKSEVIEHSQLNKVYAYQILQGKRFPSRDKIIPLCMAMNLTLDETQEVLKRANMPMLYVRNRRDCIIIFAITKGFTVFSCNELLYESNEKILG